MPSGDFPPDLFLNDDDPSGDFILQQVIQALIEDVSISFSQHGHFGPCQPQLAHLEMMLREREDDDGPGPGPVVHAVSMVERRGVTRITSPQNNLVYRVADDEHSLDGHYVARTLKFCDCDRFFRNVVFIPPPIYACEHILAVRFATAQGNFVNDVTMDNPTVVNLIFEMFAGGSITG